MFLCKDCTSYESFSRSLGPCEGCGEVSLCSDAPPESCRSNSSRTRKLITRTDVVAAAQAWITAELELERCPEWSGKRQTERAGDVDDAREEFERLLNSFSCGAISKTIEVFEAIRGCPVKYHETVKGAGLHLLKILFADGRYPTAVRPTANDGIVFYWYPMADDCSVYVCLEIFEDGGIVAAWSNGLRDDAVDLGQTPNASEIYEALDKMFVALSLQD